MQDMFITLGLTDTKELLSLSKVALRIVLLLTIAGILMRFSSKLINTFNRHLKRRAAGQAEELKRIDTVSRVFHYIATILIGVIAGVEILHQFGISIAPILTAAGVVGVAVGFGAQSLIRDYFNGFFILLEDQVRQGDMVEAGGKSGLVEEITLRHIKMRDYAGNVHYVPNGSITTVSNMSRGYAQSVIDIGVAPEENIDQVITVMQSTGVALCTDENFHYKILNRMEIAGVDQLNKTSTMIRCRFKVIPLEQWNIRREFLRRIKAAFEQHGMRLS